MLKYIKIFSIIVGLIFLLLSINTFKNNYLVYKNGVKVNGIIKDIELGYVADGPDDVFYTIFCSYNDSLYIIKQNLQKTDFKKSDSITLYFYPNDLSKSIYIPNSQFNFSKYLALVVGVVLILFNFYIRRF